MFRSQRGASFLAIIFFISFLVAVSLGGYFIFLRMQNRNVSQPALTTPEVTSTTKQDINRDGKVDAMDKRFFTSEMDCTKDSLCWDKVIGKTSDGDNPIYTKDLDLNTDGKISAEDMSVQ